MRCDECLEKKEPSDFYASRPYKCKDCVKSKVRKHRLDNLKRIQAYDRKRGLEKAQPPTRIHREKYPQKAKARAVLGFAVSSGRIDRPTTCSACGATCTPHGHHDDYAKPLEVRWLCAPCHGAVHRAINEERRAT